MENRCMTAEKALFSSESRISRVIGSCHATLKIEHLLDK
jgi:hypothetical protein